MTTRPTRSTVILGVSSQTVVGGRDCAAPKLYVAMDGNCPAPEKMSTAFFEQGATI